MSVANVMFSLNPVSFTNYLLIFAVDVAKNVFIILTLTNFSSTLNNDHGNLNTMTKLIIL